MRRIVIATGAVTTVAGTVGVNGSADGTGTAATFGTPFGIAADGTHLYVADTANHTIRRIVVATGVVTTLAGTPRARGNADGTGAAARFYFPSGLALAGDGRLHVADTENNIVRSIDVASAAVTTLAGAKTLAGVTDLSGATDGTGVAAHFNRPTAVATDGTDLYVADTQNHTIRRIGIASGAVTTLAGTAGARGSADGPGAAARFNNPAGITTDGTAVYVADTGNHTIRKIVLATGAVTTLAGTAGVQGDADGTGTAATLDSPGALTTDGVHLYVASGQTLRRIVLATGVVSTLAGAPGQAGATDGPGASARFDGPAGLTVAGNALYVADTVNQLVRKVDLATGAVSTVAGTAGVLGTVDGVGTAAGFNNPIGITSDGKQLFVTEAHTVRRIVLATGAVTTLVGETTQLPGPRGITTDGRHLFVVDTPTHGIRRIQ